MGCLQTPHLENTRFSVSIFFYLFYSTMANRTGAYGLTAEAEAKIAAKLDPQLEQDCRNWIEAVTGERLSSDDTIEALKDGTMLCKLANVIRPGSVKKINSSKLAFKQMENIQFFLSAAQSWGVRAADLFQTVDLYEGANLTQVIQGIDSTGRAVQKMGFNGPQLGVKQASENKRSFTQEQLDAGKAIPSAQMGNNKGASQQGMTAPGQRRE